MRSLVELHAGTVFATSEGVGCGSEFTIELPALERLTAPLPRPSDPVGAEQPSALRRRVLVVDDNEDAAVMMGEVLERLGYQIEVAHDGPSALRIADPTQDANEIIVASLHLAPARASTSGWAARDLLWAESVEPTPGCVRRSLHRMVDRATHRVDTWSVAANKLIDAHPSEFIRTAIGFVRLMFGLLSGARPPVTREHSSSPRSPDDIHIGGQASEKR